jgi:hypothetical protein
VIKTKNGIGNPVPGIGVGTDTEMWWVKLVNGITTPKLICPPTLCRGGITSQKYFNTMYDVLSYSTCITDSTFNFSFLICKYKGITGIDN